MELFKKKQKIIFSNTKIKSTKLEKYHPDLGLPLLREPFVKFA